MADKAKNIVLNFKMDGQVQYAQTLREINSVMNTAAKEYRNHVAAMGDDAKATDKLRAEKKKLEIQMEGAQKRTEMLRAQYEAMSKDTKTTTGQLTQMYSKLLDAEKAETSLQKSLEKVNEGLSEQSVEIEEAREGLIKLKSESELLEAEQKNLISTFNLQNTTLSENATEAEKVELAQKQLDEQMDLTRKTILNLEQQLEKTKKVYGENSTEVMQMESKLKDAITTFAKFEKSMKDIEGESKKAKKAMDGLGSGMQALAGMAPAAAIGGLVSSMEEYNQVLARLRTNAATSGRDLSVVEDSFSRITEVTGEADAAGETLANLLASGFTDNQLAAVIEQVNGAYIRFSDTLKTEGIADGIQETLAAGEAVGPFAELLERSGLKLDDFNKKLAEAQKEGEGANFVLQTLTEQGFGEMYNKYKELNPEVAAQQEAQQKMNDALSDLSITLTPLVTQVAEFTTKLIEWINEHPKLTAAIATGAAVIGGLVTVLTVLAPIISLIITHAATLGPIFAALAGPVGIAIAIFSLLVTAGIAIYKNWDTIKEKAGQLKDWVVSKFTELKDGAIGKFNELKDGTINKVSELKDKAESTIASFKDNVVNKATELKTNFTNKVNELKDGTVNKFNELKSGAENVVIGFKDNVVNKANEIKDGFINKASELKDGAIGKFNGLRDQASEVMQEAKTKILEPIETAKNKIADIVEDIKGFFSGMKLKIPKIDLPPLPHFKLSGEFSLNPPSVPSLSIDWYAKGAVFTRPTIFNTPYGLKGFGEAGPEAALPLNEKTLGMIGEGIAKTMKGTGITQNITIVSPEPTSPSENARKMKQASRQLAMEW